MTGFYDDVTVGPLRFVRGTELMAIPEGGNITRVFEKHVRDLPLNATVVATISMPHSIGDAFVIYQTAVNPLTAATQIMIYASYRGSGTAPPDDVWCNYIIVAPAQ